MSLHRRNPAQTRTPNRRLGGAALHIAAVLIAAAPAMAKGGWTLLDEEDFRVTAGATLTYGMLFTDDGGKPFTHVIGNEADGSAIYFAARSVPFGGGAWTMGGDLEFDILTLGSDEVSQTVRRIDSVMLDVAEGSIWLRHRSLGTLTAGITGGASDGTAEADLSQTDIVATAIVSDVGGDYFLRTVGAGGDLIDLTWADVQGSFDNFGGPDGRAVRYDSPAFHGLSFSAAAGIGIWDAALRYEYDKGPLELEAALGYFHESGSSGEELPGNTVTATFAALHKPTGLSLALSAGLRSFDPQVELNDGSFGSPSSQSFQYAKIGFRRPWLEFGDTALYAAYGRFQDAVGPDASAESVAALGDLDPMDVCNGGGNACLAWGSNASVIDLGVVQQIDGAGAELFLSYRHQDADVRLVDIDRASVDALPLQALDMVFVGARFEF